MWLFSAPLSPKLVTTAEDIDAYFQGIKTDMPRKITIGDYSTLILLRYRRCLCRL